MILLWTGPWRHLVHGVDELNTDYLGNVCTLPSSKGTYSLHLEFNYYSRLCNFSLTIFKLKCIDLFVNRKYAVCGILWLCEVLYEETYIIDLYCFVWKIIHIKLVFTGILKRCICGWLIQTVICIIIVPFINIDVLNTNYKHSIFLWLYFWFDLTNTYFFFYRI